MATAAPSRSVALTWATVSELGNDYFEVQHSLDGRTFTAVGRVAGHHTTLLPSHYTFQHADPGAAATHYYRLRQVDEGGSSTFSAVQVVTLAAGRSAWQLSLAPNPTTANYLRVLVQYDNSAPTPATLTVRDLLGQVVLTQPLTLQPGDTNLTPAPALAPGVYWLSLTGGTTLGVAGAKVLVTN